jgi:hypothetical protein
VLRPRLPPKPKRNRHSRRLNCLVPRSCEGKAGVFAVALSFAHLQFGAVPAHRVLLYLFQAEKSAGDKSKVSRCVYGH